MQLKPRTTYLNGHGDQVMIAGTANRSVDGKPCWWSIQGDHYTENGLFVHCRQISREGELLLESYTVPESARNLQSEDTRPAAAAWWDGVQT